MDTGFQTNLEVNIMIKRVISLIVLILLNSSCLTLCVEPEQTPATQTPATTPTTTQTTPTQIQKDKQNFEKLLGDFRQHDQAINNCNRKLKNLKFFNGKSFPLIIGILTAGTTGGICYLLKHTLPKIALWSGILGVTSIIGTKFLRWAHNKMIDPTIELRSYNQDQVTKLRNTEKEIRTYYDKFREIPKYLRNILSQEKNSKLEKIISGMLPVT